VLFELIKGFATY